MTKEEFEKLTEMNYAIEALSCIIEDLEECEQVIIIAKNANGDNKAHNIEELLIPKESIIKLTKDKYDTLNQTMLNIKIEFDPEGELKYE